MGLPGATVPGYHPVMLSRSVRQRIGSLLREEARTRPGGKKEARHPERGPRNGRKSAGREIVPTGIEEILPGGILPGREGAIFVHERLYTELREKPAPLLKKLTAIATAPARAKPRSRARDLPEAVADATGDPADPARWERTLFRTFGHRRMLLLDIETCGLSAAPVFLVGLCHVG